MREAARDAGRCGDAGAMSSGKYNGSENEAEWCGPGARNISAKAAEAEMFGLAAECRLIDKNRATLECHSITEAGGADDGGPTVESASDRRAGSR